jgi:hypothetical protein
LAKRSDVEAMISKRLLWIVAVLAGVPFLVTPWVPLFDHLNHLGRYAMLARYQNSPLFREFYANNLVFTPNLGFDLLATNLGKLLPPERAVQLILFVTIVTTVLGFGTLSVDRNRQLTPLALLPSLFVVNFYVSFGFLNFTLAMAVVPWALLAFRKLLRDEKPLPRFALFATLCLLTLICHAMAALVILPAMLLFTAVTERDEAKFGSTKAVAIALAPYLVILPLALRSAMGGEGSGLRFASPVEIVRYVFTAFQTGWQLADLVFIGGALLLLAALWFTKTIRFDKTSIALVGGFCLLFVIFPTALKTTANLSPRFLPIAALLVGSLIWKPVKQTGWVTPAILTLLVGRTTALSIHYYRSGKVTEQVQMELEKLPESAVVYTIIGGSRSPFTFSTFNPPRLFLAQSILAKRSQFVAGTYTIPSQQPIVYTPLGVRLDYLSVQGGLLMNNQTAVNEIVQRWKYEPKNWRDSHPLLILLTNPDGTQNNLLSDRQGSERVAGGSGFAIYRLTE